jgi:hypothetical protein
MFLVVYAWWAVSLPPFSGAATAAVLLAGGLAIVAGASGPRGPRPEIDARRAAPWVVLVAVGGVWQLAAYLQQPREDHPTLSSLANALLDSHAARAAAFVLWIVAAVQLSRR